jgi:S-formylglutathione hydrolase
MPTGAALPPLPLLVDQGEADEFLATQLRPELLREACDAAGHPLTLRLHPGYDHSYYFIASFIGEHIAWHAAALRG